MNDEDNDLHDKSKDYKDNDNSIIDGVNSFVNSSRNSSEDDKAKKASFDIKFYLKNELDLMLKVRF